MTDTSQRALLKLFAPLAISGIFFPLARPIVNAAIARADNPEIGLAAYSVAFSLTIPLLSPLFGLRQIVTSLAVDQDMIRKLGSVTLTLAALATVPLTIVAIPSVYLWVARNIVGVPDEIALVGPPIMLVLITAPIISVARGYYQGILVKYGQANAIGYGAFFYLVFSVTIAFPMIIWLGMEGGLSAVVAFTVASVAYAFIVWVPYRRVLRERIPERDEAVPNEDRNQRAIYRQYYPLAVSSILMATVEPLIQTAIARSPGSQTALAAYPVLISLTWLSRVHLWNAQQLVIARVESWSNYLDVRRFITLTTLITTAMLGCLMIPAVSEWIFGTLIGLRGPVKDLAVLGFPIAFTIPALQAVRSFYYGTLITKSGSQGIQTAAFVRIVVLVASLAAGVTLLEFNGLILALLATILGDLSECITLRFSVKKIDWET